MELRTTAQPPLTVHDYWNIAVRQKRLILGTILLSLIVAGVVCLVMPKSYRSSTLILVEGQKIPEDYVKGIVGGSVEERITMIQQYVMSRTLLSKVIEQFNLYQDDVRRYGLETVIEEMREIVKVKTVASAGNRGKGVEAFSVSFAHEDPVTAMKVTAKVSSLFIEQNLKLREELVEGASEFLAMEVQRVKQDLEQRELAISEFKKKYMGELPQQTEANLRALDRKQNDGNALTESLHRLTDRYSMRKKAIEEYQLTGTISNGSGAGQAGTDPLVVRYKELERALVILTAEYKDSYPDVIQVKQEIEEVEAQLAEKYGVALQNASGAKKPFDPYLQSLIEERDEVGAEIDGLKRRQRRLTADIEKYEGRIERAPAREQELMILVRDYDNMRASYQSLLNKRLNARVAENLEKRQKGEQFRIIDPANLPETPEKLDILRIMLVGLALGCGVGFGTAFLVEQMNPTFRRSEDLELLLGLQVLAAIPDFAFLYGHSAKQRRHSASATSAPTSAETPKRSRWRLTGRRENGMPIEQILVAKSQPASMVAEQYRVAATRLSLMEAGRSSTVLVTTSAVKGEGKTTTVVNLGYTLARDLGKRTLLIDCDFKCPALHRYVAASAAPGLADVLDRNAPLEACLAQLGEIPLWIMPVGSQETKVLEFSKTHQLATILTNLRAQFDYILLDAPPVLPLADMNVLAGLGDGVMLVVHAMATSQQVVHRALNSLRSETPPLVILNAVEASTMPYYMYYDYRPRPSEELHV